MNEFGIKPAQVKNSIKAFEFLEKHQLVERNLVLKNIATLNPMLIHL